MTEIGLTYKTQDLYLAAFVKAEGMSIVEVEKDDKRGYFIFRDQTSRPELVNSFFNDAMVSVNDFKNALRDCKQMLYA